MPLRQVRVAKRACVRLLASSAFCFAILLAFTPGDASGQHSPVPSLQEEGFHSIFDGQSLNGWDCDPDFWSVKEGAIVGQSTMDHQPKQNTFCIWKDGKPGNFELRAEYRLTGVNDGNSGIQYRSV